jgi:Icc-related predicted phosphoesterase
MQAAFLQNMGETLGAFIKKTGIAVGVMLGNDDFKTNIPLLKYLARRHKFHILDEKGWDVKRYRIFGYPFVPLTPFRFKDWELLDAKDVREEEYRTGFVTEGFVSRGQKLVPKRIIVAPRRRTIEGDLAQLRGGKNTIWVTHSPPFNSALDMTSMREHVGSLGIKNAILKQRPLLTLHGHIHETVNVTGVFKERIGATWSYASGNDPVGNLRSIIVDTSSPGNGVRRT